MTSGLSVLNRVCVAAFARLLFAVLAAVAVQSESLADQILETNGNTLTHYATTSMSAKQFVRPLAQQRGVFLDGTGIAPSAFDWALAGNPFGDRWDQNHRMDDIRLDLGTYAPTDVDLSLPAPGFRWTISRSYNPRQEAIIEGMPVHYDSDGVQGYNWFQDSHPELVFAPGDESEDDVVYILYGADRYLEFKRISADVFKGKNGVAGYVRFVASADSEPETYTYFDQHANQTVFFGSDHAGAAAGQFWKMTDPAGNVAYVGDATTGSTAISSGYSSGRIVTAYDTASRRYTHTYDTVGGHDRLVQIKVETKTGATWASPGTVSEVAIVDYSYYTSDGDDYGMAGDLKLVSVKTTLSDSGTSLGSGICHQAKRYYRYYDDVWDEADERHGEPHMIKTVVGEEGTRNFDWTDTTFDGDYVSASDSALTSYAEVYLKYEATGYRIATAAFNGECACVGGTNGAYDFSYLPAPDYGDYVINTSYDSTWAIRTSIKAPAGAAFITLYSDEVGQPMARVQSNHDPADTENPETLKTWATRADRGSAGQMDTMYWPANITYTWTEDGSGDDLARASDVGLIRNYGRIASGDLTGFLASVTYQVGTGGTAYYEAETDYRDDITYTPYTGVAITRPFVAATRQFVEQTSTNVSGYNETTYTYTMHSSAAALMPKVIQTTLPDVDSMHNGSGTSASRYEYRRADATLAFAKTARGIFTYTQHTNGQIVKRIDDCDTTGSFGGDDPFSAFGISEAAGGYDLATLYEYDAQGRLAKTTGPDGLERREYWTRLLDERLVHVHVPRVFTDGSTTFYGPARYSVMNLAGGIDADGLIGVDVEGTTNALSTWINESSNRDVIDAVEEAYAGSLVRLKVNVHSPSGHRVNEAQVFHHIPSSYVGATDKTDYDRTAYTYDAAGRRTHINDPSRTIIETKYDPRNVAIEKYISVEDGSSFAPSTPELFWAGGNNGGESEPGGTGSPSAEGGTGGTGGGGPDGSGGEETAAKCYMLYEFFVGTPTTVDLDPRGRPMLIHRPIAPHTLYQRDNLGRAVTVAQFSDSTGLAIDTDPTIVAIGSEMDNRRALSQSFYDERGRLWKATKWEINQSTGVKGESLDTLYWYDDDNHVVKIKGNQLVKINYDRLGREVNRYILANDDDSDYADVYDSGSLATDVAGDIVLEQHDTVYDNATGEVVMSAVISRFHDDYDHGSGETTGALDIRADASGDPHNLKYTDSDVKGRIQITANWFDEQHRVTTSADYGTNAGWTFDRYLLTEPTASSSGRLVTLYKYDSAGETSRVTNPRGKKTAFTFDDAGRRKQVIENFDDGDPGPSEDEDRVTEYGYGYPASGPGLIRTITARRISSADDQTTTYTYGVREGDSEMDAGFLLGKINYPDNLPDEHEDLAKVVKIAYDIGFLKKTVTDQAGNAIAFQYDEFKRETTRTIGAAEGFDPLVAGIYRSYTALGQLEGVFQMDDDDHVLDEEKFTYDGWGNLTSLEQDPDSGFDVPDGRDPFTVAYTYETATGGRSTIRRTGMTLTGGNPVGYTYASSAGRHDDDASRVSTVTVTTGITVDVATYEYLGASRVVGIDYPALPSRAQWHLFGGTSGVYDSYDQFDRIVTDSWVKESPATPFYDVRLEYDENSNPTLADEKVPEAGFDVRYSLDSLDRLIRAEEGTWSGSSITPETRDEKWTLSLVGNATVHQLDLDGDGLYTTTGLGEVDENNADTVADTERYSKVNELLTRDTDNDAGTDVTLAYDLVGNMIGDGTYAYVYDPLGRLRKVLMGSDLVAEYRYNGLGYRIAVHSDVTDDMGGAPDGFVTGDDAWYFFAYDEQWRIVGTYRNEDADLKEQFVHHNAGFDGQGGSSYIDAVILRERDGGVAWKDEATGDLDERHFICQNRRGDSVAVLNDLGWIVDSVRYSSYGVPYRMVQTDYNQDGFANGVDFDDFVADYEIGTAPALDVDHDGYITGSDFDWFVDMFSDPGITGRGTLSSERVGMRIGYAGYQWDAGVARYHVRNRVYAPELARWLQRDPLEYVADSINLYQYADSSPISMIDPDGTIARPNIGMSLRERLQMLGQDVGRSPTFGPNIDVGMIYDGDASSDDSDTDSASSDEDDGDVFWAGFEVMALCQPPAPPNGSAGAAEPTWDGCMTNCMKANYGMIGAAVCAESLGIDWGFSPIPKSKHEMNMPHKKSEVASNARRAWTYGKHAFKKTFKRALGKSAAKIASKAIKIIGRVGAGTVGRIAAAASCGFTAGVGIGCAAQCANDKRAW